MDRGIRIGKSNAKFLIILFGILVIFSSHYIYHSTFAQENVQSSLMPRQGPSFVSLVISDPDGGDAEYSNGDVITATFNMPTNRPSAATKANLEKLFTFSQSIGNDFTGSWTSSSVLKITIVDVGGAANPTNPLDGGLTLVVNLNGNLRNKELTSLASTDTSDPLTGSVGDKAGPSITDFFAKDPNNDDAEFDSGDTLTLRFSEDTNTPPVATKAQIDDLLEFTPPLDAEYSGVFSNTRTLTITIDSVPDDATPPVIGEFIATVKESGGLTSAPPNVSLPSEAVSPPLSGTFGQKPGPFIVELIADDPDGGDAEYSNGDTITAIFSEPTNQPTVSQRTDLDKIFDYTQSLGTDYTGRWNDAVTLVITIVNRGTPPFPTADDDGIDDGELRLIIKPSGNLKAAGSSLPSEGPSPLLTGNFGTKPGPNFLLVQAADPDGTVGSEAPGLSDGDTITLTFNENTNRQNIATKADIDKIFAFEDTSQNPLEIGDSYIGSWLTKSVAQITILDTGSPVPDLTNLVVRAKPIGNLKDEAGTSFASDDVSDQIVGNFGLLSPPEITNLIAKDPSNDDAIFDNGDTITVRFNKDTTLTPTTSGTFLSKAQVDSFFTFSQEIGDDYRGFIQNRRTFVITATETQFLPTPPVIGELQVTVKGSANVQALGGSIPTTAVSPPLSGTFGNAPGPIITEFTARDPFGQDAVFGINDILTVKFNKPTNELFGPILDKGDLDSLFTYSDPDFQNNNYQGEWFEPDVLEITILDATGAEPIIGSFNVQANTDAGLKVQGDASLSSGSASPALVGNFGTKPGPQITSFVAGDPNNNGGITQGDTFTITFDEATNEPDVSSREKIDDTFTFNPSNALTDSDDSTVYSGEWFDPRTLIITIDNPIGVASAEIGSTTVSVTGTGSSALFNSARTSLASDSISPALSGDFGKTPAPEIISLVAHDPDDGDSIFSKDDTITLIFDRSTNKRPVADRTDIDKLLTFSQIIGDEYSGKWNSQGDKLEITIDDAEFIPAPPVIGELKVTVKGTAGLKAEGFAFDTGDAISSTSVSPFISGSWGNFIEEISLCEGGEAFSTFPDGKTAEISFAGSECGGFTFEVADENESERIEFLGEPLRITPSGGADCSVSPFCNISFVFRADQIPDDGDEDPATELDPFTDIKILKDVDADEQIDDKDDPDNSVEVFNGLPRDSPDCQIGDPGICTPDTTVVALDSAETRFEATALTPSNSKFAIGGIKALALGAVAPSISTPSTPSTPSTSTATSPAGAAGTASGGAGASGGPQQEGQAGVLALTQVKLYEVTWDKCDENLIKIIAGPPGEGLSVKIFSSLAGLLPVTEAIEQPFKTATVYEAPIDQVETFIRVQIEGVLGREASLAQRSIDLKECTGQVGGFSEPDETITPTIGAPPSFPAGTPLLDEGAMFETSYKDIDFGIGYKLPEGEITNMNINEEEKSVTFDFNNIISGKLMLSLPRGMISADENNFVLLNPSTSEQIDYEILESGSQYVTLEMTLPEGTQSLTVVGTSVVPEFGILTTTIFVVSVIALVMISRIKTMHFIK